MKQYLALLALACAAPAFAALDTIALEGDSVLVTAPGRVVSIGAISSVANGTASVKAVRTIPIVEEVETVSVLTNGFTYTYVSTNAEGSVTNTVPYLPLPLGDTVTSYVTNAVTQTVTNRVPTATSLVCVTNAIGSGITCSGGTGSESPSSAYLAPGDVLFYEGTASGRVILWLER